MSEMCSLPLLHTVYSIMSGLVPRPSVRSGNETIFCHATTLRGHYLTDVCLTL